MRFALACSALSLLLLAAGCGHSSDGSSAASSKAGWKEFDPEKGKFSVSMPGDPQPISPTEMAGMSHVWGTTAGNLTYRVGYQDLSLDDSSPDQHALDERFDTYIETIGARESVDARDPRRPASVANTSGAEFSVTVPGKTPADKQVRRVQLCVAGGRMYRLDVTGPADVVASADADVFFNSLKIAR